MLRLRATMISSRLLSKENLLTLIEESSIPLFVRVKAVISVIDERISLLESQDTDEYECALEALGQIRLCK
ncbi:putative 26S proteasome non-ATPase regulatory subunit 5 [Helianthus annuus]|nr:putative 26S proteasome non-ATPase regulatory subunit 5 [Helianthus annuus]